MFRVWGHATFSSCLTPSPQGVILFPVVPAGDGKEGTMLPDYCRWTYKEHQTTGNFQWLQLRRDATVFATFLFMRRGDGRIDGDNVCLRLNLDGASKDEIFASLWNSADVDGDDREHLCALQENFFLVRAPGPEVRLYFPAKNREGIHTIDDFFSSPEGELCREQILDEMLAEQLLARDSSAPGKGSDQLTASSILQASDIAGARPQGARFFIIFGGFWGILAVF